jgi:four helix bundle protein
MQNDPAKWRDKMQNLYHGKYMPNSKEEFKKEFIARLIRYSVKLIKFCDKLREEGMSFCLIDQLIDAGTSMGSNVVEAKSAHSVKDYIKFFEIALKSANETKYWLLVVREITKMNRQEAEQLLKETIEIANILASSILTLKGKK